MKLLVIEDNQTLAKTIVAGLTQQNYVVDLAYDGETGLDNALAYNYDLILLDINLPHLDSISLCRRLRQAGNTSPIVLLSASAATQDMVAGLDAGADDYIIKPCPVEGLAARIRALLRRNRDASTPTLQWGNLEIDPSTCEVTCQGQPLRLSPKEYSLLYLLMSSPTRIFSQDYIIEKLWTFGDPPNRETVKAHVKGLRRKLKKAGVGDIIETVYGFGYRLKDLCELQTASSPLNPILERFVAMRQMEYLILNPDLTIREISDQAHKFCDFPEKLTIGQSVCISFPELIGLDDILLDVLAGKTEDFRLEGVARSHNPQRPEYIDIYSMNVDNQLFLLFEDVSPEMSWRQTVTQQENETYLLLGF